MKTIWSVLFLFVYLVSSGQSSLILPSGTQNYKILSGDGKGLFINSGQQSMGTYINATSGWIQTHSDQILRINGGGAYFTVETNCNIQYNAIYKLGSDAPAIRSRVFTGTTSSTQDGFTYITPVGLDFNKILSINLIVNNGAAGYIPYNYTYTPGYQVDLLTNTTQFVITTVAGNSANILNKPFKLYVTYSN